MADSHQVKGIFNDALETDVEERGVFIEAACAGDDDLKNEILSLLESYGRVKGFLDVPASSISAEELAAEILQPEEASAIGKRVGAYRIEKEIGRGGMGAVFLARRDDETFHKWVAIKLIRRDTDNDTQLRRFQNEHQILAGLEHPNIARLIDAGSTTNGLPYFVMEYIDGIPVNRYCEEAALGIEGCLQLFLMICSAVEFAHSHSVIHRDIKPSNILVTHDGVPKLLDFGIAKSISVNGNGPTPSTATALRMMTPEYASPEQMRGHRVTTRSDVYSLGVLLYELLTHRRPYDFDSKSPYEIVQAICEDEPIAPSRVVHSDEAALFPNDLENIILKALRKEPERRYDSVREFSDDITRYSEGRPVAARQEEFSYRVRKFIKRQRPVAIAFAIALMFALVGFGVSRFADRARAAPTLTERLSDRRFGGTSDDAARDLYIQASALWEQRTSSSVEKALDLFQQAIARDPNFSLAYSGLANSYFLSNVWGQIPAEEAFSKAREAALKAIDLAPDVSQGHLSLAMADWQYYFDWQAADREFRKATELDPTYELAPHWYGLFLGEMGRSEEAVAMEKRAEELDPASIPVKADYARVLFYGRRYEESLEQYQMVARMDPNYMGVYYELADFYERTGRFDEMFEVVKKFGEPSHELLEAYRTGGIGAYEAKVVEIQERDGAPAIETAGRCAYLGQTDKAIGYLYQGLNTHDHRMAQVKIDPRFDNIRSDPRFVDFLRRANL